jgi:hypothetical protein
VSVTQSTHPNATTIEGLREVAAWLEQHPELPAAHYAAVSFRSAYAAANAREDLTALAVALGDRANESVYNGEATISARFADTVRVSATAKVADLGPEPASEPPPYVPIIQREVQS